MFRARTLFLFGVAFLLALAAVFIAQHWVRSMQDPSRQYTPVVVAAREITFLSPITEADLKLVDFPKGHAAADSFRETGLVVGKLATRSFQVGEVILASRIHDHLSGSLLAHALPENARAVSVRVNDVSGVGGFVLPGSLVDVLVSRKGYGARGMETEIIVQAAKVMAVGQETSAEKQSPIIAQVVTLELSPPDAERVIQASAEGSIHLVLRNPLDHSIYVAPKPTPSPATNPPGRADGAAATPGASPADPLTLPPPGSGTRADEARYLIKGSKEVRVECTPFRCDEGGVDKGGLRR